MIEAPTQVFCYDHLRIIDHDLTCPSLAKVLKVFPEIWPGVAQIVTHINSPMVDGFFVLNVERHANGCDKRAVLEIYQEVGTKANDNHRLGRRVSITILPV